MQVKFYAFEKRRNSTKTPGAADGYTQTSAYLKEDTSILNPELVVDLTPYPTRPAFNYVWIDDFNRYYFVDDVVNEGRLWRFKCSVDVMGSFRSYIIDHPMYMTRCSDRFNRWIMDNFYPPTGEHQITVNHANTPWLHIQDNENINIDEGTFILGVVADPYSTGAGSFGSIRYYAITKAQMYDVIHQLLTNTVTTANGFDFTDATQSLQKGMLNPLQYIKSCIWFPLLYNSISGVDMTSITIWDWTISASCKLMTKNPPYVMYNTQLPMPAHPQVARGKYLNLSPYTRASVLYPPFGLIDLDTALAIDEANVNCQVLVDLITGMGTLDVRIASVCSARLKSQVGVPIQLSEVGYDYTNMAATAVGIGTEAINTWIGDKISSGLSNTLSMIGSVANAMRTKTSSLGGNGSFAELRGYAYCYMDYYLIPDEDLDHAGRPLCETIAPSSQNTGTFMMAREADLQISTALKSEIDMISSILTSGFYYE